MSESQTQKHDVRIVLVRPRNPLNIGASARAMLNFGFDDLVVVAPYDPVWQESKAAMAAADVLRNARAVEKLSEALDDRNLVVGASSLTQRELPEKAISLDELSKMLGNEKAPESILRLAILFGSEKTGLSREDISRCHWVVRIPTLPNCPSMNLGQAVAVVCYELSRMLGVEMKSRAIPSLSVRQRAAAGEMERIIEGIEVLLGTTDNRDGRARAQAIKLRRMLLNWPITSEEASLVLGILRDVSRKLTSKATDRTE